MHKLEFIKHIMQAHDCDKSAASKVVDMFTSSVTNALGEGEEISLVGFGLFTVKKTKARVGRNPRTGKPVDIPACNRITFKAGKKLKDACNK